MDGKVGVRMRKNPASKTIMIVAFALLILLPLAYSLEIVFPIRGKLKLSVTVEAVSVDNGVVFFIRHAGGDCVPLDLTKPYEDQMDGIVKHPEFGKAKIEEWIPERPDRFCEGDIIWAKVSFRIPRGERLSVRIWLDKVGLVFDGLVTVR
ncbi:MAG: hypothetical protein N2Z84_01510 [Atribacterota bacterium]|nr:hypothetical protein [Atribacterota bacterium]